MNLKTDCIHNTRCPGDWQRDSRQPGKKRTPTCRPLRYQRPAHPIRTGLLRGREPRDEGNAVAFSVTVPCEGTAQRPRAATQRRVTSLWTVKTNQGRPSQAINRVYSNINAPPRLYARVQFCTKYEINGCVSATAACSDNRHGVRVER